MAEEKGNSSTACSVTFGFSVKNEPLFEPVAYLAVLHGEVSKDPMP